MLTACVDLGSRFAEVASPSEKRTKPIVTKSFSRLSPGYSIGRVIRYVDQTIGQIYLYSQSTRPRLVQATKHADPPKPDTANRVEGITIEQNQEMIARPSALPLLPCPDISDLAAVRYLFCSRAVERLCWIFTLRAALNLLMTSLVQTYSFNAISTGRRRSTLNTSTLGY